MAGTASPSCAELALGALVETVEHELLDAHRRLSHVRERLAVGAAGGVAGGAAGDAVEVVTGVEAVRTRLEELSFFTRRSVWSVQPLTTRSVQGAAADRPLAQRSTRRGLDSRVIYLDDALASDRATSHLRGLAAEGFQVRTTSLPVQRLLVLDEEVAVVPTDPTRTAAGAVVVRQPGLLAGLVALFHHWWEQSSELPCDDEASCGPGGPGEQDAQILRLLGDGCTDEVAARQLGVSVRHLRRKVAALMADLGAASRFQAGVAAAQRGWI